MAGSSRSVVSAARLFRPSPELSRWIAYYGYLDRNTTGAETSRVLPRGAATVVIDLDSADRGGLFAADGSTKLSVPPAFIAGAGTSSYVTEMVARQEAITVHFRPGGAWPFVGGMLGELEDTCVGLDDVWGRAARLLHQRLVEASSAPCRSRLLDDFLKSRVRLPPVPSTQVSMVLDAIERNPSTRVAVLCELVGLSAKGLIQRFRREVGMAPKSYARVRRFQAARRRLDASRRSSAETAVQLGYFDQAHFSREFHSFTAMTPTHYCHQRLTLPGHVELGKKYPIPRGRRNDTLTG